MSNRSLLSDRLGKEIKQFYGGFSDFNALGAFSGMMFIWSTYEIKKNNILGFFTFFVSLTGGILSGSRTFLFFIIAGIINLFLNKNQSRRKQHRTVAVILILGVLVIIVLMGSPLRNRFSQKFPEGATVFETLDRISEGRLWMTMFSLETIRDHLISGVGAGNFTFYLTYKNYGKSYIYDLTLNDYLLIFAENGLFAFIFFFAFIILLFRRSQKKLLIGTVLFALLFNNFFWFPEIFLLFLILAAINDTEKERLIKKEIPATIKNILILLAVLLTLIFNMVKFNSLHPATWARETVTRYDFGFWYIEEDERENEFRWTKNVAGIFIKLNKNGESPEFKLRCGAPLAHLESNKQKVDIYWKGRPYREVIFKENKSVFFKIKSRPLEAGFLELKILPDFNLKKMGLSTESRDLGVQFYGSPFHWE